MEKARDLVIHQSNFYNFKYIIYNNTNIEKFNKKISIETLCHEIRKKYFLESIKEYNLDRILTGHTLTDQLEHFFIGIIRHSSIKRISGMQEDSFIYFRPLLFMHKQNTKLILDQIKQEYVLDPCNNNNYLRNNLRNKLISMLNKIDDRFENGILSTMKQLYEFEKIIQQATNNELKKNDIYQIDYFLNLQPIIQQKTIEKLLYANNFFKEVSLNLCEEIIRFLKTKEGGEHKIKTIIIIKKQNEWKIINNI
jgi:tRNA(Ile)-lysidine synthase TilS/MesJ